MPRSAAVVARLTLSRTGCTDNVAGVIGDQFVRGDRVEYVGAPLEDPSVEPGAVGCITNVAGDVAAVVWRGPLIREVPVEDLRLRGPEVTRAVAEAPNRRMWELLGQELPPLKSGRPRDPYLEQSCHPDAVSRVWRELGKALPRDCRAQAKGKPVLAHPETDRIIALAHGTAYALWLTPEDFPAAVKGGGRTVMVWSGGSRTDLGERAGPGWIWGAWHEDEPRWVQRAYAMVGPEDPPAGLS
jgi:hypothetical protein